MSRSAAQIEHKERGRWMLQNGYSTIEVAEACDVSLRTAEEWYRYTLPPPEPIQLSPLLMSMGPCWDSEEIESMRAEEKQP